MIPTLRVLPPLLVLTPFICSSKPSDTNYISLAEKFAALNLQDQTKPLNVSTNPLNVSTKPSHTPQIPHTDILKKFLDFIDYSAIDVFDMGINLRNETLKANMETIVAIINEKLGFFIKQGRKASTPERIRLSLDCFARQGHDISSIANAKDINRLIMQRFDTAAAVMFHGFFDDWKLDVMLLIQAAMKEKFINILRILQACYVWTSQEQFHWFLALSYKSKWYDSHLWKSFPTDWSKNLHAIFTANNSFFIKDLPTGRILPNFGQDLLLNLVATYDLIEIYHSFRFPSNKELVERLELLAKSGSFKILRFLAETTGIQLHLEDYHPSHTLPDDFEFFWMQGYRYLPISHFLSMACEHGRDDILEFFYQLNPRVMVPTLYLTLAAKNGHLSVLKWAFEHELLVEEISETLIFNEHFEVFEQLQKDYHLKGYPNFMMEKAAKNNQLNVVKWLHKKFEIVPSSYSLDNSTVEMLKWIDSVAPQQIQRHLTGKINLDGLKWIVENHPDLLTNEVKIANSNGLVDYEKLQWMLLQGWKASPDMNEAASKGKVEMLKFGYNVLQTKPTKTQTIAAARYGHVEALKLIYSIHPLYVDEYALYVAIAENHLEAAKYLESVLKLKGTEMHCDLETAFESGNLGLIKWVYRRYKLLNSNDLSNWLEKAIVKGHLKIVDWAIEKRHVLKSNEEFLKTAAKYGQYQIFQRLIDYGLTATSAENYITLAFESGSLGIVKHFLEKNPKNIAHLKQEKVSVNNYHLWLWLQEEERRKIKRIKKTK